MANSETFHFGEFRLDLRERRLLRGAEVVRLLTGAVRQSLDVMWTAGHFG